MEEEKIKKAFYICSRFPHISSLDPSLDAGVIRGFIREKFWQVGNVDQVLGRCYYRNSLAYRLQATRGKPLVYFDGESLINFGFGRDGREIVAVGPMGPGASWILVRLASLLKVYGIQLHVKKVSDGEVGHYLETGFALVDFKKDFAPPDLPDD